MNAKILACAVILGAMITHTVVAADSDRDFNQRLSYKGAIQEQMGNLFEGGRQFHTQESLQHWLPLGTDRRTVEKEILRHVSARKDSLPIQITMDADSTVVRLSRIDDSNDGKIRTSAWLFMFFQKGVLVKIAVSITQGDEQTEPHDIAK